METVNWGKDKPQVQLQVPSFGGPRGARMLH